MDGNGLSPGNSPARVSSVEIGELSIDLTKGHVTWNRGRINVTVLEFRLLALLALYTDCIVAYPDIISEVWKSPVPTSQEYGELRSLVHRLRQKIEPDPAVPRFILTIRGRGLLLKVDRTASTTTKAE